MRPPPFVEMCDKVDAFTRACHGRHEVDGSRDEGSAFYKTLECPRHHRRRVGNLQEAWLVPFSSFLFFFFPPKFNLHRTGGYLGTRTSRTRRNKRENARLRLIQ